MTRRVPEVNPLNLGDLFPDAGPHYLHLDFAPPCSCWPEAQPSGAAHLMLNHVAVFLLWTTCSVNMGVSVTSDLRPGATPSMNYTCSTDPVVGAARRWEQTRLCCFLTVSAPGFIRWEVTAFASVSFIGCTGS